MTGEEYTKARYALLEKGSLLTHELYEIAKQFFVLETLDEKTAKERYNKVYFEGIETRNKLIDLFNDKWEGKL